jgi:hypothetical protein
MAQNAGMPKRPWENDELRESDGRFPSGRWVGYWVQESRRGRMQLDLTFGNGRLFGDGRDWVGDFVLSGGYDPSTGKVSMHKAYLGCHGVDYDGRAGATGIRGTWQIVDPQTGAIDSTGPFHIWPAGSGGGVERSLQAEAPAPVLS